MRPCKGGRVSPDHYVCIIAGRALFLITHGPLVQKPPGLFYPYYIPIANQYRTQYVGRPSRL